MRRLDEDEKVVLLFLVGLALAAAVPCSILAQSARPMIWVLDAAIAGVVALAVARWRTG